MRRSRGLIRKNNPGRSGAIYGFTLVEILIVLAIIAIIAAIAVPSYREYLLRSRHTDAMIALQQLANKQERYYFDNNRYGVHLSSIGMSSTSPHGYFTLQLTTASSKMFIARASPAPGSSQSGSGQFEIRSDGLKTWDPGEDGSFECSWEDAAHAGVGC